MPRFANKLYHSVTIITLLMVTGFFLSETSFAHNNTTEFSPIIIAQQEGLISEKKAARIVKSQYGGRILNVKLVKGEAGSMYKVKILLKAGRVKSVLVDAKTGALL